MSQLLKILRKLSEELGYITLEDFLVDLMKEYYEQRGEKLSEEKLRELVRYKLTEDLLRMAVNKAIKELGFNNIEDFLNYVSKIEKIRNIVEKTKIEK